jgi:sec-independent protein translocase protein TatB
MFNIGPLELIVILLVALLVVGPKRLPEMSRTIGKSLRELRRTTEDMRRSIEFDVDDDDEDDEPPSPVPPLEEPEEPEPGSALPEPTTPPEEPRRPGSAAE